jgi:hypothetical protein
MCHQTTGQQQSPSLRKGNTRAACISSIIINNQDLDRASRIRPPAPPAIVAHQPSSAQCIFTAQAYPDTPSPPAKPAIYSHTAAAKQNTAVHSGWRQRLDI